MLAHEFFQGTTQGRKGGGGDTPMHTMQLTTPRFHIQVLVLLKTSYFQEKETTNSVPI